MMLLKKVLSCAEALKILNAAKAEAEKNNWAVSIAVVDDGGHPLALSRLDGCAPMGAHIALEKAKTSALGRKETKIYETMINEGRAAFLTVPFDGMLEGGVPVVIDGQVAGAVGVSGVKSEQDAQIARNAIAAVVC